MQRLLDGDRLQRAGAERTQRCRIGALHAGDGQDARILRQIERVLYDVTLKALTAESAGRQFDVERQFVDRLAQAGGALPGGLGELRHGTASLVQSAWK